MLDPMPVTSDKGVGLMTECNASYCMAQETCVIPQASLDFGGI